MDSEILNLTFASSLTNLCEINSSFDSGVLRIAYVGDNRNGSSISKETFEKCLKTIYNCPVVCNYDRDTDTLGGHDMEIVCGDDGAMRIANLTQPVGVIPQSAQVFWESVEEDDGIVHEYLCAEVLIWKRQEAYQKIKRDGITAQSMEINVKAGNRVNGIYRITDFEFTAFALIGVEPCYESASLQFSKQNFKQEFSKMMLELKDSFNKEVNTSEKVDTINSQKFSTEGGNEVLDKQKLIEKYGIDVSKLDFSIDDFTAEELEEKFKAISGDYEAGKEGDNFSLASNVQDEIIRALSAEKVQYDWGECSRYWYEDHDAEAHQVYCWDSNDWLLYGFSYAIDGDAIKIDFDSKTRKKYTIVDFDEGEQTSPFSEVFEQMHQAFDAKAAAAADFEAKYQAATESVTGMESELLELRQFKADTEKAETENARKSELADMFAKFTDLDNVEEFAALKTACEEDCMKYELDDIELRCYAIRGKQGVPAKFNHVQTKVPKIPVIPKEDKDTNMPYGGIFEEFGFSSKQ